MFSSKPFFSAVAALAAFGLVRADEPAPAPAGKTAAPAPADFTAGLKRLGDLGLPELSGYRWIDINQGNVRMFVGSGMDGRFDYNYRQCLDAVNGRAWVRLGDKDTLAAVLPGNPAVAASDGARFVPDESMRATMLKMAVTAVKSAKPADLAADVDKVVAKLAEKAKEAKAESNADSPWRTDQNAKAAAGALLFAAQILRSGDAALANRLAGEVFKNFPDRQAVLNAALSGIADGALAGASDDFFRTGDWSAYAASVRSLVAKFPRGWANRGGAEILLAKLEARAKSSAGVALPAGTDAATVAAVKALRDLVPSKAAKPAAAASQTESLWTLPKPAASPEGDSRNQVFFSSNNDFARLPETRALTASGFAAIPALAALLRDETLVALPSGNGGTSYSYGRTSAAEKAKQAYGNLRRPVSFAEIARALLAEVLPGEEYKLASMDADTLAERAEAFRAEHAADKPSDLAVFYLREGSSTQKRVVRAYFTASDDPVLVKIFEDDALASADIEGEMDEVLAYVRARRGKAVGFAKKYVAKLKEAAADTADRPKGDFSSRSSGGVTRVSEKQLQRVIAQFGELTSGLSPKDALLAALKKTKNPAKELSSRWESMREIPDAEREALLLDIAASSSDVKLAGVALQYFSMPSGFGEPEENASAKKKPYVITPEAAKQWAKLLADKRSVGRGFTVAATAAYALDSRFGAIPEIVGVLAQGNSREISAIVVARAKARLDGKPVPPYPDPSKVTEARMKEIVAGAMAATDAGLGDYLKTLTPDERVAWLAWWSFKMYPEMSAYLQKTQVPDVALPDGFAARSTRFAGPAATGRVTPFGEVTDADAALAKSLVAEAGLKPGDTLDAARIAAFADLLARNADKYSGCMVVIAPDPTTAWGRALFAHRAKIEKTEGMDFGDMAGMMISGTARRFAMTGDSGSRGDDAVVSLMVYGGNRSESAWRVKAGKVTAPAVAKADDKKAAGDSALLVVLTAKDAAVIAGPASKDADE